MTIPNAVFSRIYLHDYSQVSSPPQTTMFVHKLFEDVIMYVMQSLLPVGRTTRHEMSLDPLKRMNEGTDFCPHLSSLCHKSKNKAGTAVERAASGSYFGGLGEPNFPTSFSCQATCAVSILLSRRRAGARGRARDGANTVPSGNSHISP